MAATKKPEVKETAAKATEAAKKTVVKAAEVEKPAEKKAAPKAAEAEKPVEKKEAPKAAEAEKKPAAKKAAAKKTTAKTAAAKKSAAKTATGKKSAGGRPAARKVQVNVQFYGKDVNMKDLEKQIVDNYVKVTGAKKSSVKEIQIYVKPEESKAYYVIGGETYSIDI